MKSLEVLNKLTHEELLLYSLLAIIILTTVLFLSIYMIWVPFWPARLVHIVYLAFHFTLISALKRKRYLYVKLSIIITNIVQLSLATFLWFPLTTNYELFYFLLPMGSFVIMDITKLKERVFALAISFASLFLFFISRFSAVNFYIYEIGHAPARIISFFTILSTMTILILYFYLHAYYLAQKRVELEYLANTDSLTDISNRRNFYNQSKLEFDLAHKYNHTFTLLLMDIDHFKKINDTYGHDAGDEVLRQVTKAIKENVRDQDIFARHGGEEFTLLLRRTDEVKGLLIAEKIRHLIEDLDIMTHGHILKITVSIGVVQFTKSLSEFDMLVNLADHALYEAKRLGRNRFVFKEST
ncbi:MULTISPECIES: GGDEF domain-containing protein [unclassified Fusibacter]|uniref:GGDEF domain-containing protein n=1 Tax=unclassified Fusibacter TaxID=2624464 RepID=UPI00101253FB|nr:MULTISPECIES: GGDEF domain-containing protein [unclassified Fusibacter]MCK8060287.1 GGDEF domain-containing protein [Fusibacter sp. A2]NPE20424.1 GGDEF domain-containing protein [Fusibacter sp. A1]RXV63629.1 GGDEF domain-containing protein [Fusibacter sp. A1]